MLVSVDDPRYVDFVSCRTSEVELILVLPSQNDFDALKYVACVIFSRILLDHRFPTNVFLTSVDDVCPNQIYHCPARNFSFIMEIIHLLVLIRCPNSGKYNPCDQIPNRMQNSTLPLLGAFCEPFQFSTLNRPKGQSESYLKNSGCVCNGYRSGGRGYPGYISGGSYRRVAEQISEIRGIDVHPSSWKVKRFKFKLET